MTEVTRMRWLIFQALEKTGNGSEEETGDGSVSPLRTGDTEPSPVSSRPSQKQDLRTVTEVPDQISNSQTASVIIDSSCRAVLNPVIASIIRTYALFVIPAVLSMTS